MGWEPMAVLKRHDERRLASDQRAGSFARAEVTRLRRSFIRAYWWVVITPLLGALVLCSLVLLLPHWCRQLPLGVVLASGVWGSVMVVITFSGTIPRTMGATGEQWTAHE